MKEQSLFNRRRFLNGMLGGWVAALAGTLFAPVIRFVFPPQQEPDEIILNPAEYLDIPVNSVKSFPWGGKPGLLKKNEDGSLTAFVAVCTHLDCNVSYIPEEKKFFCACHDGWFNENGVNIAGPPPSPLKTLDVEITEEQLFIRKQGLNSDE